MTTDRWLSILYMVVFLNIVIWILTHITPGTLGYALLTKIGWVAK